MLQETESSSLTGWAASEAQSLAAALVRNSPEGVIAFDVECRYTVWNEAMERIAGVPASQVLGRCAFEVFPFLKEIGEDQQFYAALAGKSVVSSERRYAVDSSGRQGVFEGRYAPLRSDAGQIIGGIAIIREVTERKRAEAAQQQVTAILERIADGFCAFDNDWRFTYLNQEAIKVLPRLGKTPEQLLGRSLWDEFPDLTGTVLETEYRRAVTEQVPVAFELCLPAIEIWFEIRAHPSADGLSVFFQDVTDRKRQTQELHQRGEELAAANEELQAANEELQAQQEELHAANEELQAQQEELQAANEELQAQQEELAAASEEIEAQREELATANEELREQREELLRSLSSLRASERRFQAVFEQKLGFLAMVEPDGTLIDCNQLPLDLAGFTRDQVLGMPFWDTPWWVGLPEMQRKLRTDLASASQGRTAHNQGRYRLADGTERLVEYSMSPVFDDLGQVTLVAIEGRDITDKVRAEERQQFLVSASEILASSLDYESTLERVARHALPTLADLCMVDLVGPDGELQRVATAHVHSEGERLLHELQRRFPPRRDSPQPASRAFRSGKTDLVTEVTDEALTSRAYNPEHAALIRKIDIRSHLAVPLKARDRIIGIINLGLVGNRRRYGVEEVALAEDLARRAALAVDNARLYRSAQTEIMERERAERAARESDARLQFALEATEIGYWDLNLETHAAHRSLRHDQIFGYKTLLPEWTYERFLEHVLPEDREAVHQRFGTALTAGQDWDFECRIRRVDGALRWIWAHGSIYQFRDGQPVRMLGIVSDVTERKALEETLLRQTKELQESDQQKDQFIAMLAHELRNPLAAMSNALQVMSLAPPESDPFVRAKEVALRQLQHQTRLVDDLLDVSRIQRGKIELREEATDLVSLVNETAEDLRESIQSMGITLSTRLPDYPLIVSGDRTRLAQVFGNLLENARRFTPTGGEIMVHLGVDPRGEYAELTVRDTGIGIDAQMLPQVFESFVQANNTLDRSSGGLGLGLSIVKGMVELHGGTVSAASEGRGRGSSFLVRLPLSGCDVPEQPEFEAERTSTPRLRVLLIEDSRDAADTLCDLLELVGYQVAVAFTGPQGIERARSFHPQVVLCDIGLPGLSGYEVARQLRADPVTATAHLIALTGYGTEQDRQKAREAGFDQHLTKPVQPEQLQQVLADAQSALTRKTSQ